jgi:putative transposase
VEISAAHKRTRETYGAERLKEDLASHGVEVGIHRIKRIRRKLGLRCKQKKKFKATTNSKHNLPVANNLVDQIFQASRPCQIWLGDITYIATDEGWLYLAGYRISSPVRSLGMQ